MTERDDRTGFQRRLTYEELLRKTGGGDYVGAQTGGVDNWGTQYILSQFYERPKQLLEEAADNHVTSTLEIRESEVLRALMERGTRFPAPVGEAFQPPRGDQSPGPSTIDGNDDAEHPMDQSDAMETERGRRMEAEALRVQAELEETRRALIEQEKRAAVAVALQEKAERDLQTFPHFVKPLPAPAPPPTPPAQATVIHQHYHPVQQVHGPAAVNPQELLQAVAQAVRAGQGSLEDLLQRHGQSIQELAHRATAQPSQPVLNQIYMDHRQQVGQVAVDNRQQTAHLHLNIPGGPQVPYAMATPRPGDDDDDDDMDKGGDDAVGAWLRQDQPSSSSAKRAIRDSKFEKQQRKKKERALAVIPEPRPAPPNPWPAPPVTPKLPPPVPQPKVALPPGAPPMAAIGPPPPMPGGMALAIPRKVTHRNLDPEHLERERPEKRADRGDDAEVEELARERHQERRTRARREIETKHKPRDAALKTALALLRQKKKSILAPADALAVMRAAKTLRAGPRPQTALGSKAELRKAINDALAVVARERAEEEIPGFESIRGLELRRPPKGLTTDPRRKKGSNLAGMSGRRVRVK